MLIEMLLALCEQFNIPTWAAHSLKNAHDELTTISDRDSIRYSVASHAYQEMLENHEDLSLLALAYNNFATA